MAIYGLASYEFKLVFIIHYSRSIRPQNVSCFCLDYLQPRNKSYLIIVLILDGDLPEDLKRLAELVLEPHPLVALRGQ